MRIAVVGKGNVGGGLADRWEKAGHEVARIGRDGGDVSDADAVLFAVPGGSIAEAVENVSGARRQDRRGRHQFGRHRAAGGVPVECRVPKVEDGRPDGKVVQHQFRCAIRAARARPRDAQQPLVRRR